MTDTVSSFSFFVLRILVQLNTFCYFGGIITRRSSEEFLAWMPNITTFFSRCMSPFKTTSSLRDSMYYYTFIAELIINISIPHVDFKHWVRTHEMTERTRSIKKVRQQQLPGSPCFSQGQARKQHLPLGSEVLLAKIDLLFTFFNEILKKIAIIYEHSRILLHV